MNAFEMAQVGRSDRPARSDGGGGHETVVGTDVDSRPSQLGPELRVRARAAQVKDERRESGKDGLYEASRLARWFVVAR